MQSCNDISLIRSDKERGLVPPRKKDESPRDYYLRLSDLYGLTTDQIAAVLTD